MKKVDFRESTSIILRIYKRQDCKKSFYSSFDLHAFHSFVSAIRAALNIVL